MEGESMANDSLILEFMSRVADLEAEVKNLKNTTIVLNKRITEIEELQREEKPVKTSAKYIGLSNYLKNSNKNELSLTFKEIEEIIGQDLPESARIHKAFWANTDTHSISLSWMCVGYRTRKVKLPENGEDGLVEFYKMV